IRMLSFQLPPGYELPKPRTDRTKLNQNNYKWALLLNGQRQVIDAIGYIDFLYDAGRDLYVPSLNVRHSDDSDPMRPLFETHRAITAHWQHLYGATFQDLNQAITDAFFDERRAANVSSPVFAASGCAGTA